MDTLVSTVSLLVSSSHETFVEEIAVFFGGGLLLRYGLENGKAEGCIYPNLRPFGWVSYDKITVLYSGKLGNKPEARASGLRSYPGLWWKRIKLRLDEGNESEYSTRTCSIGRPAEGHSVSTP